MKLSQYNILNKSTSLVKLISFRMRLIAVKSPNSCLRNSTNKYIFFLTFASSLVLSQTSQRVDLLTLAILEMTFLKGCPSQSGDSFVSVRKRTGGGGLFGSWAESDNLALVWW